MNTDPYPNGRWNRPSSTSSQAVQRPVTNPGLDLVNARLSELFWAPPELELLAQAARRVDELLHTVAQQPVEQLLLGK